MSTRFPMFPWERENARIGANLVLVEGNPGTPASAEVSAAWLDDNEQLRKEFVKYARMSGASAQWREAWARKHPAEWARWEAAWARGEWQPEGWQP